MFKALLIVVILVSYIGSMAQITGDEVNKHEISLISDNDNYTLSYADRYYTNGLVLGYSFLVPEGGGRIRDHRISKIIIALMLGQKIYTPSDIEISGSDRFDRPYAGWLFLGSSLNYFFKNQTAINFNFDMGLTGSYSMAEKTQKWWHKLVDYEQPAGWDHQIADGLGINFKARVTKSWPVTNFLDIISTSELQWGTHFQNGFQELAIRIGAINPLDYSALMNSRLSFEQIDMSQSSEHYILAGIRFTSVLHNALIQGDIWSNPSPHVETTSSHYTTYNMGWNSSFKNYTVKIIWYYMTPEVIGGSDHKYASIFLSFRFK